MTTLMRVRGELLHQLLNLPQLVTNLQVLPPEKFHQIVESIGLEDCAELVSLATADQLQALFDIDLWANRLPGEEEHFDARRFMLWLEILLEAGEKVLLEKVDEMDEELLAFGLSQQLFVFPTASLESVFQPADDYAHQVDSLLESCLYDELYEYQLFSRNPETWDTVFTLLVAMDKGAHAKLIDLLEALCSLGEQQVAEDDLYSVLCDLEALKENVADKREGRRLKQGYVPTRDARAFLQLARVKNEEDIFSEPTDPISAAYFRQYTPHGQSTQSTETPGAYQAILEVLERAEVISRTKPAAAMLAGTEADGGERLLFALHQIAARSPDRFSRLSMELGFLGNVVVSGCTLGGERFRAVDASAAVTATCALGLELYFVRNKGTETSHSISDALMHISLLQLFLAGWKALSSADCRSFPVCSEKTVGRSPQFVDRISLLNQKGMK